MNGFSVATPLDAVLFDLDGTLVNTPLAIAEQLVLSVSDVTGIAPPVAQARALIGKPLPQIAARLAGISYRAAEVSAVTDAYLHRYRTKVVPRAKDLLFPGVTAGLRRLLDNGLRLAVVTAKVHDSAEILLNAADIAVFFDVIVGADDTPLPKPSPDPGLRAIEQLQVLPAAAVMVGDTTADIRMANAIPMRSIAVSYGVGTASALARLSPTCVATCFDEVIDSVLNPLPVTERTRHEPSPTATRQR